MLFTSRLIPDCKTMLPSMAALSVICLLALPAHADSKPDQSSILVPVSRSSLVVLPQPMAEVMVANPDIADVHAHNSKSLTGVGKKIGHTNVRIFDKDGNLLRAFDVTVGFDLPAIRKSLKNFLPNEVIGVEMVNTSIALTGQISSAGVADEAVKIVKDFMRDSSGDNAIKPADQPDILNMMKVISGQQVMLRVRVGEIDRTALKSLGVDIGAGLANNFQFATGANALAGLITPATSTAGSGFTHGVGQLEYAVDSNNVPLNTQGLAIGRISHKGDILTGAINALEQDGLFRLLAEPNLVAISGEEAQFLAGGEIPIPVPQTGTTGGGTAITIEYKPYGVAVKFKPIVLSENRIRMEVQPEVSELDDSNALNISGFQVPALTTRRANTTIELGTGESFMIAGLLKDQSQATVNQLPGVNELPVIGALFRSTQFQRNETELVIAVTPYVVDPLKNSDVKLPTDNFRPASEMEMFFYGALGSLSGNASTLSQTPPVEGPIGFMVD